ncbi:hypothetical protein GGI03_002456 [Coemansia sp. RSA 2337]|nr:hypothetical protein GGI03_002456 [Coemansia sp. RSA 2337]
MTESPPTAERQRPNKQVRDGAAHVITGEGLLEVVGRIAFFDVGTVADIYELAVNRPLFPADVEPQSFALELAGRKGFSRWRPRFAVTGSASLNGLSLLLRPQLLQQFGPAQYSGAVMLDSRLCYILLTLDALPPEKNDKHEHQEDV